MKSYLAGFVALICLLNGNAFGENEVVSNAEWRVSWEAFVRTIAPYYLNKDGLTELRSRFDGASVTWDGKVVGIYESGPGKPFMKIAMTPLPVKLLDGPVVTLESLTIAPYEKEKDKWASVTTNQIVRFRTKLKDYTTPQLFDVMTFDIDIDNWGMGSETGRTHVVITSEGAELVSQSRP